MEKFSLLQPDQCFNVLVNEVGTKDREKFLNHLISYALFYYKVIIEEPKGIKLGLAPFKYLTDTYLLLNYSISSYVSKMQV